MNGQDASGALALAQQLLEMAAPCRHSADFSGVLWYGTYHVFTGSQARVVKALWEAWLNGTPDLRQETLLEVAGREGRLRSLFQGHPAWGTMIVAGPLKGLLRLAVPENSGHAGNMPQTGA